MEINLPISVFDRQKFAESSRFAPFRDDRNTPQAWKKTREMSRQNNSQIDALQLMVSKLSRTRRKPLGGGLPAPASPQMFPFKIYTEPNQTATAAQRALFTAANAPIDSLTLQIRGGYIGVRGYINDIPDSARADGYLGNSEQALLCGGTDAGTGLTDGYWSELFYPPTANSGTCIVLDNVNPTLICGIPANSPPGTPPTFCDQIVLNQNPDLTAQTVNNTGWAASFWIEIIDDPNNGLYLNLMGLMVAQDIPVVNRSGTWFPCADNVIPVGIYSYNTVSGENLVSQLLTGNLLGRFPKGYSCFRGYWNTLFSALPSGQTSLVFYPGDCVVDTTTRVLTQFYQIWMVNFNQQPAYLTVSQSPNGSGLWLPCGLVGA